MSRWLKAVAVALAAVGGLVLGVAQVSYAQTDPVNQAALILPEGDPLSDAELLDIEGDGKGVDAVVGGIGGAVLGTTAEIITQRWEIREGTRTSMCAVEIGRAALVGTALGVAWSPTGRALTKAVEAAKRYSIDAARWVAATSVAAAERAHDALHIVHKTLHTHVRERVGNFFMNAWDWVRCLRR
jgi:hypothetical protein